MATSFIRVCLLILTLIAAAVQLPAQEIVSADAVAGEPFGVGRLEVLLDSRLDQADAVPTDLTGRVFYPTVANSSRRVRKLLRELVGAPQRLEVYFLFTGAGPLDLSIAGAPRPFGVRPVTDNARHVAMLGEWWRRYASLDERNNRQEAYPQLVEDYLLGTLARRMRLPLPEGFDADEEPGDLKHAIRAVMGADSIRGQWVRRVAAGREEVGEANLALPEPLAFPAVSPEVAESIKVEPMALRVPPDLFYVRFGSFPNYLWFSHRLDDWGGEVANLVSRPSIDYGLGDRQAEQLALKESAMAEIMGPAVISDAALIGTDMFQRDGAAMGILFEARNSLLLANDINADRSDTLKENPTAKEEKVTIAGQSVSFLHTPDNRIRSFYIALDGYHLVTTSRYVAERFIQVAKDGNALGKTNEFRLARSLFPIDRGDTIFVYLSSAFLQNLLSPRYQVELQRRMRSLAEIDVLSVARVEASAAGRALSIGELADAGYLSQTFGQRADGSRLIETEGRVVDSVRGPRGMFLPVPDVPIEGVTQVEAVAATAVAEKYAASWEQLTPIIAAIGRSKATREGLERVSLDVRLTPLAAKQYSFFASFLGAPSKQRLAPVAGDVVAFDAVLSQKLGGEGDYHLFGGLRNIDPRMFSGSMMEKLLGMFGGTELVGYVGAWPRPGLLWFLGATADLPVDEAGYSQFITGSWRRIIGQFTLMSFQPELLASVAPQLKFVAAARPAQGWLRADDLRESPLAPSLNAFGYRKAAERSRGNMRFLNSLSQQLHVPPADALTASQSILAANLVCPLGGKYELAGAKGAHPQWRSTALATARDDAPPADYEFPALYWLRGIEAELRLTQEELAVHADLEMPVKERAKPKLEFPSFGLPFGNAPARKPAQKDSGEQPKPKPESKPREF